jgi:hypothetical protein
MTNISVKSAKHCLSEFDKAAQQTCNQLKTPIFPTPIVQAQLAGNAIADNLLPNSQV